MTINQSTQPTQLDLFDDEPFLVTSTSDPYWMDDPNSTIYGTNAGNVLTAGTNGISWGAISSGDISFSDELTPKTLTVQGDAEFKGNLTVGGIDLVDSLKEIERRLNILRVDPVLEERWEKLRELGDAYRALEAECIDKDHIIDLLKR